MKKKDTLKFSQPCDCIGRHRAYSPLPLACGIWQALFYKFLFICFDISKTICHTVDKPAAYFLITLTHSVHTQKKKLTGREMTSIGSYVFYNVEYKRSKMMFLVKVVKLLNLII